MEISRYASRLASAALSRAAMKQSVPFSPNLPELHTRGDVPGLQSQPGNASADTDLAHSALFEADDTIVPSLLAIPRDLPQEPEDARITGGTRSLSRRLLALNIPITRAAAAAKPRVRKPVSVSRHWISQDA
jgi:hypothetical protein